MNDSSHNTTVDIAKYLILSNLITDDIVLRIDFKYFCLIPQNLVGGFRGKIFNTCSTKNRVAVTLLMSMNAKQSQKIVAVIKAYRKSLPITLFLYGDFVELFPDMVQSWASNDNMNIGIRGATQYPTGHLEHMKGNWVREGLVSSQLRLSEIGVTSRFYFPDSTSEDIKTVAKSRGVTIIRSTAAFPPVKGSISLELLSQNLGTFCCFWDVFSDCFCYKLSTIEF